MEEAIFGTGLKDEPLTWAEIEHLMKKKGIKLTEDEIQKIMKGDKEAMKKLDLNKKDLQDLKEMRDMPKLTDEEIWRIAKEKGIKLTEDDIRKIKAGDKEALKKLGLTKEDIKKIKDDHDIPKLTEE